MNWRWWGSGDIQFHLKEPDEKDPEKKSTDDPKKEGEVEQKEASDPKEVKKKVTLVPVTTTKWRVENSWGDDKGDKGYLMMTDEWYAGWMPLHSERFFAKIYNDYLAGCDETHFT